MTDYRLAILALGDRRILADYSANSTSVLDNRRPAVAKLGCQCTRYSDRGLGNSLAHNLAADFGNISSKAH